VKVECSTDKVNFYEIADLAGDATSFVNTGLSPSVTYSYRVRAYNTGGYSDYTDTANFTLTAPVSEVSGAK
jgi:titin